MINTCRWQILKKLFKLRVFTLTINWKVIWFSLCIFVVVISFRCPDSRILSLDCCLKMNYIDHNPSIVRTPEHFLHYFVYWDKICWQENTHLRQILWVSRGWTVGLGGLYACRLETRRLQVRHPGRLATFFRGDWSWNIFSTVILSLLLIQEGQLSVSGERMCTILVNRLED